VIHRNERCEAVNSREFLYNVLLYRTIRIAIILLPRDALVHSAVLRLHVVRPTVTLMDQDHIGRKSGKLIARTISQTPSLFVAQKPSTYSQGNMGNLGETRGEVGKSGVMEHKSGNISETRKDRGKVTMESL